MAALERLREPHREPRREPGSNASPVGSALGAPSRPPHWRRDGTPGSAVSSSRHLGVSRPPTTQRHRQGFSAPAPTSPYAVGPLPRGSGARSWRRRAGRPGLTRLGWQSWSSGRVSAGVDGTLARQGMLRWDSSRSGKTPWALLEPDAAAAATVGEVQLKLHYSFREQRLTRAALAEPCVAVIGAGGYVGRRVVAALAAAAVLPLRNIRVASRTTEPLAQAAARLGVTCCGSNAEAAACCQVVVLSLRAVHLAAAARSLAGALLPEALVVSMVPLPPLLLRSSPPPLVPRLITRLSGRRAVA